MLSLSLLAAMFAAGVFTILLPCILPLIPIVLGVSIAGRSKWRPLLTIAGMLISFVGFTFLLLVVLSSFVELADYIRIGTYYVLLLFGMGFVTGKKPVQLAVAAVGGLFFISKGWMAVIAAAALGMVAMELGGRAATRIQQFGTDVQSKARGEFGADAPVTALIIGLTLGLVWVPCAGPALGFALTLVREQPGPVAMLYLFTYGLGTAIPLLIIGYGGQTAVHSVRALAKYSGRVKQVAGALLIISAVAFHFRGFEKLQVWLLDNTMIGDIGTQLEDRFFGKAFEQARDGQSEASSSSSMPGTPNTSSSSPATSMNLPTLPKLVRAPTDFPGLGPWHNGPALTQADLKGKVVLIDFWTYSCINCIRTLPYIRGYWDKYKDTGKFVLLGVHTPEFVFEKSQTNVAAAIKNHNLTHPVAQDNDFKTWDAFANRYWPAKYLIDADGYIRYTHFGEGDYEETDKAIASLLLEAGVELPEGVGETDEVQKPNAGKPRSPETYLGDRSWPALGNSQGEPSPEPVTYKAPEAMTLNKYYLSGTWRVVDREKQVLGSGEGEIRMKFLGGEINMVLGPGLTKNRKLAEVFIDGQSVKTFDIGMYDSYNLFTGEYGEHEMVLKLQGAGTEAYAFTFGG